MTETIQIPGRPEAPETASQAQRTRLEAVESLLTASRAVLRFTNFEDAARRIFDEAKRMTGATAGYVALLSDAGDENEILFLDSGGMPCSVDPQLPMPIRGLRAEAYRRQEAVFENSFWGSEWKDFLPDGHMRMGNVLFAPLTVDGKTVGLMGLANKPADFTPEDALMATAFGEFAAIALSNSWTYENLKQTVSNLEDALSQVRTLKEIIPICMKCRKLRDDQGYWSHLEAFLKEGQGVDLSHGLCPDCASETEREWGLEPED